MRSQGCWSFFGAIYRLKSAKVGLEGHAVFFDQHGRYPEWDGPVAENILAVRSIFSEVLK